MTSVIIRALYAFVASGRLADLEHARVLIRRYTGADVRKTWPDGGGCCASAPLTAAVEKLVACFHVFAPMYPPDNRIEMLWLEILSLIRC